MPVVEAIGLEKSFGSTKALCGLDLEVERGAVLGVLGPNGAGKTTAVRVMTTLLQPDGGRAFIDGIDVVAEPHRVRARIGLTGQYAAVDERLTGRENIDLMGRFFRLTTRRSRERAAELLDAFDLTDAGDRVVKGYSGGMRRRLDIAMSLVARPKVLFLDEPTTGLDPRSRLAMWDLLDELVKAGTTTLLTTQYLEEADRLAHSIIVVDHGTVIARGTAAELKAQVGGDRATVLLHREEDAARAAEALLAHTLPGSSASRQGLELGVCLRAGVTTPEIVHDLDRVGVEVQDVSVHRPTLDDVFLTLTGHDTGAGDDATEDAA
jgi:ABC-2 type transport system ATP-binding protein